ncbi:MAG: MFS transporter, partial [Acidimicrobiales bacterium]
HLPRARMSAATAARAAGAARGRAPWREAVTDTFVGRLGRGALRWLEQWFGAGVDRLTEEVGGPARRRVILLLACVLALDSADKGAVGALAVELEGSLHVGNTGIGLLVTVSSLVAAVATLPIGVLADRTRRTRILMVGILVWSAAEAVSGLATSYLMLLLTRLALGAVVAVAGPAVASLTGDLFTPHERGRIYGFILTGELVGAGAGLLVAGDLGSALGWRAAFFILAVPGVLLAWAIWRLFPEPARGGQSRIVVGAEEIVSVEEVEADPASHPVVEDEPDAGHGGLPLREEVAREGIRPAEDLVLHEDPAGISLVRAVRYVLSIRTNVVLIVASSLGYFFFGGLRTFALLYLRGHYSVGQGAASLIILVVGIGAVAGILLAGRLADRLIGRGHIDARVVVGAAGYVVAAVLFLPAILTTSLAIAVPVLVLAAAAVAAPNPALDAARLDVMPSRLWGRAESVRTVLRTVLEAFAPLLFGVVSQLLGGGQAGFGAGVNTKGASVSHHGTRGLELTFLIMLVPLLASGVMLWRGRKAYPVDVATAGASEGDTSDPDGRRRGHGSVDRPGGSSGQPSQPT